MSARAKAQRRSGSADSESRAASAGSAVLSAMRRVLTAYQTVTQTSMAVAITRRRFASTRSLSISLPCGYRVQLREKLLGRSHSFLADLDSRGEGLPRASPDIRGCATRLRAALQVSQLLRSTQAHQSLFQQGIAACDIGRKVSAEQVESRALRVKHG